MAVRARVEYESVPECLLHAALCSLLLAHHQRDEARFNFTKIVNVCEQLVI